jgi:hypothetical protein
MKAADAKQYAAALDLVEQRRKSGSLTDGEADVWRGRLLAEASRPARPAWVKVFIVIAVVIVGIIIMRLIVSAMGG